MNHCEPICSTFLIATPIFCIELHDVSKIFDPWIACIALDSKAYVLHASLCHLIWPGPIECFLCIHAHVLHVYSMIEWNIPFSLCAVDMVCHASAVDSRLNARKFSMYLLFCWDACVWSILALPVGHYTFLLMLQRCSHTSLSLTHECVRDSCPRTLNQIKLLLSCHSPNPRWYM